MTNRLTRLEIKDWFIPESRYKGIKDEIDKQKRDALFNKGIMRFLNAEHAKIRIIMDWLLSPHEARQREQIDLGTLTFEEAVTRSRRFHEEVLWVDDAESEEGGETIENEKGQIVMRFPSGFYWIRLGNKCDDIEAEAMSHCGRGQGILYSLRLNKKPFVTLDYDEETKTILEARGKGNSKPHRKYVPYLFQFVIEQGVENISPDVYQPENSFAIVDAVNEPGFKKLIEERPNLLRDIQDRLFVLDKGINTFKPIEEMFIKNFDLTLPYEKQIIKSIFYDENSGLLDIYFSDIDNYFSRENPKIFTYSSWQWINSINIALAEFFNTILKFNSDEIAKYKDSYVNIYQKIISHISAGNRDNLKTAHQVARLEDFVGTFEKNILYAQSPSESNNRYLVGLRVKKELFPLLIENSKQEKNLLRELDDLYQKEVMDPAEAKIKEYVSILNHYVDELTLAKLSY